MLGAGLQHAGSLRLDATTIALERVRACEYAKGAIGCAFSQLVAIRHGAGVTDGKALLPFCKKVAPKNSIEILEKLFWFFFKSCSVTIPSPKSEYGSFCQGAIYIVPLPEPQ